MISFKSYVVIHNQLIESLADDTRKITHLSHPEDLGHEYGKEGGDHAIAALHAAHDHISHGAHNSNLTTKADGGIAILAGKHPLSGRHMVAYKGELDKVGTPAEEHSKISYSHADIDKHYGDKPYVAHPLHAALDHAHKSLPKDGLHQGDVLFDEKSKPKKEENGKVSFEPNLIKYSAKKSSTEGKKIARAKFGAAWHTTYKMDHEGKLQSHPIDHEKMTNHDDSYNMSTVNDASRTHHPEEAKTAFHHHMAQAEAIHKKGGQAMYDAIKPAADHISTYINSTVRSGEKPSAGGLQGHIWDKHQKLADKVSTEKSKATKIEAGSKLTRHIDIESNYGHINAHLQMHHHLQAAKNVLVKSLDGADHPLEHHIDGNKTAPEGYVSRHKDLPVKLVNRQEFSKKNFAKSRD